MKTARSSWQQLASRTNGVVTPGNIATVVGMLLTLMGLWYLHTHVFGVAFLLVAFGRVFDLLDGHLARLTHTTSLLGEFIDAAADKVVIGAAALVILFGHAVPFFLMVPVLFVQVALVVIAFTAKGSGVVLHSSRAGKYSTFVLWVSILLYMLALWSLDAGQTDTRNVLYVSANLLMTVALFGSLRACAGYLKPLLRKLLAERRG